MAGQFQASEQAGVGFNVLRSVGFRSGKLLNRGLIHTCLVIVASPHPVELTMGLSFCGQGNEAS